MYDNKGNIIRKREFAFTLRDNTLIEESESTDKAYIYNGDKLLSYNGQAFDYDDMGNPKKYCGKTATWTNGRLLATYDGHTFTYDGQGRRITRDGISYTYDSNGRLIRQSNGLSFIYDHSGVTGFTYGTATYLYRKDIQGNVLAILDSNGAVVARYRYDAWGNHTVVNANGESISDGTHVANLNPIRYRGYYYDTETGLYYLKSRYYDPVVGRFITIDSIEYIDPETINGLNLYAYCGNNPVMNVDPSGTSWWTDFWNSVAGKIIGTILVVAAVAVVSVLTAGVGAAVTGVLGGGFFASILGGAIGGAISGAVIGVGFSIVGQGVVNGYGNIDWKQVGTATVNGLVSGAISGAIFGLIGASVRGIKIFNASRKGLVIGKMGNFEQAAKSMNLSHYNGLKGYKLVEKVFGKNLATKIGWAHNKAFVKSVMRLGGAIVDIGGELSGAYAREVALIEGYQYLIVLSQLLF